MVETKPNLRAEVQAKLSNDASADYGDFAVVFMGRGRLGLIQISPMFEDSQTLTYEQAIANGNSRSNTEPQNNIDPKLIVIY